MQRKQKRSGKEESEWIHEVPAVQERQGQARFYTTLEAKGLSFNA